MSADDKVTDLMAALEQSLNDAKADRRAAAAACTYETDYQCGRCGSGIDFEDCGWCEACGHSRDDPDPNCPKCNGTGRAAYCTASPDWCDANVIPGREHIARHTAEGYVACSCSCTRRHVLPPALPLAPEAR